MLILPCGVFFYRPARLLFRMLFPVGFEACKKVIFLFALYLSAAHFCKMEAQSSRYKRGADYDEDDWVNPIALLRRFAR